MKNDLIRKGDVIKLIKEIKYNYNSTSKNCNTLLDLIIDYITVMPEVYNVDNVIEVLSKDIEPNVDGDTGEPCNNWVIDMINELTARHIEIVKRGLISNKNEE